MTQAMGRAGAEALGLEVLGWLAEDDARMAPFLAETGADAGDLRAAAGDAAFLGFVLDHLLADESRLLDCCAALGLAPEAPARARAALPGGDLPHWT